MDIPSLFSPERESLIPEGWTHGDPWEHVVEHALGRLGDVPLLPPASPERVRKQRTPYPDKYQNDSVTVDVTHGDGYKYLILSDETTSPLGSYHDDVFAAAFGVRKSAPRLFAIISRPDETIEVPFVNGERHGLEMKLWGYSREVTKSIYNNGKLHNPYGPAEIFIDNGKYLYYIHGQRTPPELHQLCDTATNPDTSETELVELTHHSEPHVAYFAAHNPNCPELVKLEWELSHIPIT